MIYSLILKEDLSRLRKFLQENILTYKESQRKWFADQLLAAIRHRLADFIEAGEIAECVQFLVRYGFFESESFAKSDQEMLRQKLFSLLSLMTSAFLQFWSRFSVLEIAVNEKTHDRAVKFDSEIKKIRKDGLKTMNALHSMVLFSMSDTDK